MEPGNRYRSGHYRTVYSCKSPCLPSMLFPHCVCVFTLAAGTGIIIGSICQLCPLPLQCRLLLLLLYHFSFVFAFFIVFLLDSDSQQQQQQQSVLPELHRRKQNPVFSALSKKQRSSSIIELLCSLLSCTPLCTGLLRLSSLVILIINA